jgi:hypothetical protein
VIYHVLFKIIQLQSDSCETYVNTPVRKVPSTKKIGVLDYCERHISNNPPFSSVFIDRNVGVLTVVHESSNTLPYHLYDESSVTGK